MLSLSKGAEGATIVTHWRFVNDATDSATIDTWTEWVIPLKAFAAQGINLSDVDRIAIGLGTKGNMTAPGASGKIFIDYIRLYRPRDAAAE